MATAIAVVRPTTSGVADPVPVGADTVAGNEVTNSAGLILTLNNTDAAPHTVTFTTPVQHSGFAVSDHTVVLAASTKRNFAGFSGAAFGRALAFSTDSALVMISAIAAE